MDFEKINQFNEAQQEAQEKAELLSTITSVGDKVAQAVNASDSKTKSVTITNDLAKPSDIAQVVEAVRALGGELKPQDIKPLADALNQISEALSKLPTEFPEMPEMPELPEQREDVKVTNLQELKQYFDEVVSALGALKTDIKFDPKIEVKPADVNITEKEVDLKPITAGLDKLEKAFKAVKTSEFDTSAITSGLSAVQQSINGLSFPVPNYVLPFKDTEGKATQINLTPDGKLPVEAAAPVGGATEVEQVSQTELLEQLTVVIKSLIQSIVDPVTLDRSLNRTRQTAIVESGTITTVGTVTTVTGLTNIDSYQGKLLMVGQDMSAWATTVRARIT